ncbi:MAG: putative mutator mutt protein (7,8-dihydro-8-oxoguanine-triphosphatase) [Microgenomates group bacterium GW2011_GWF2_45_18]|nr:MAG: putative mutator mutt protein (7,8-dihydro-8-oxoguanine-triphosphatase) [Microgenomates group bacterium GW2011_GWF1_44_10]KKU01533.1 MAG: putative mutator mutt protein (7,8-dihydro-8-oxoguanine-triphosphatase) [Microgenomates group bacterium GW2011_GWF2_45_18]OGJ41418.1 MAG: hypothetical protein A2378_00140 [Candidatus Pacebacteria bacterium RIFOXYB1_FULL_44_10]HAU99441.1 hypothetical protein [Candidatus Paceibacterota bacterium]HAX01553.1 hypothetical protein [Candidatus Paceibacterota
MLSTNKDVGRFMVAVGGVLEAKATGNILLVQRHASLDWQPSQWEIIYGRLNQGESTEDALRREFTEEVGFNEFYIKEVLRTWHIYRGVKSDENELIGITFSLQCTEEFEPKISAEHQNFIWTSPEHAIELCSVDGIREDLRIFQHSKE